MFNILGLLVLVCIYFGISYVTGPASTESLAEINKLIDASKGQPYEAEFKSQISDLMKDGITRTEAEEILHIYEEVRLKTSLVSKDTKSDSNGL
ncbi:TPA: hypothetical protein ACJKZ5_003755, partial [Acinetobacter baumannii]|nr:hypothetical protein [Acinetobacter baumannii]